MNKYTPIITRLKQELHLHDYELKKLFPALYVWEFEEMLRLTRRRAKARRVAIIGR